MLCVGVLALQGSFREHMTLLARLGVTPIEVGGRNITSHLLLRGRRR
jgi:glutamine amidotransferase PdxT